MTDGISNLPVVDPVIPSDCEALTYPSALSQWRGIVRKYEEDPEDISNAWLYVGWHPVFWELREGTDVPFYLLPGGAWYRAVEMGVDRPSNAEPVVWMEAVRCRWYSDPSLDELYEVEPNTVEALGVELDSFEETLRELARRIHDTWGNDRESLKLPELEERWRG